MFYVSFELDVALCEISGEGEHPCPPDVRTNLTMDVWFDYDLYQEMYRPVHEPWNITGTEPPKTIDRQFRREIEEVEEAEI